MKRTPLIAVAAALVALVCAPAALADSIAYVKDGNVWLSTTDGSRQYQVTYTGGYSDVSQADDGTMIGLNGVRLHKLDRAGNVLANFDTPVSDTRPAPAKTFYGPYDPAISPDGTKVAYTFYWMTQTQNPGCLPPTCLVAINEGGTGYTWSDRQTSWDDPALGRHTGWRHPAWIDNDNVLLANPTHLPNNDVIVDTLSDGDSGNLVKNWFSDTVQSNPHVSGGDVTRDKRKLAFQTGDDDSTLTLYSVPNFPTTFKDGDAPANTKPIVCYRYSGAPGGRFSQPTFAPDGTRVAWGAGDGVYVAAVPDFSGGCTLTGATPSPPLVIPGGREPDWGPADVPAPRRPPGPIVQPQTQTQQPVTGGGGATLTDAKTLAVKLKRTAHGVTVRVTLPSKGRVAATAKAKGKVVGKASRTAKKGPLSLTLRLKGRPKNVTVAVTFKPATGATRTGTATLH